jgi:putative SOS response-associated peptidase YedK
MENLFGVELLPEGVDLEILEMQPSEEIAPGSVQPVVWLDEAGHRRLTPMRWGFQLPDRFVFNTRSETAEKSRFWQKAYKLRRCLIPADGFYEWAKLGGSAKTKLTFTVDGGVLVGLAGVWSPWLNPKTGCQEKTFSILTGAARELMADFHDRQPAMIDPASFTPFLAPSTPEPTNLLQFYAAGRMEAMPTPSAPQNPAQGLLFAFDNEEANP